jgi:WD40 repeat protein
LYGIGIVHTLALAPDGRYLVAGDDSPGVQVWEIKATAKVPGKVKSTTISLGSQPYALAFSPQGRWLASAHAGETLRIGNVATWLVAAEMRAAQWYGACAWAPDGSRLYVLGQNTLCCYDWWP